MLKKILVWLPAVLYMALIFYLSSRPAPPAAKELPIILQMKVVHLFEYGFLSLLFYWALANTTGLSQARCFLWAVVLTVLYGVTDEIHQLFVPTRTASFWDLVANFIGASLTQGVIFLVRRTQP